MRRDWTTGRGWGLPVSRRRVGRDWGANQSRGWHIGEVLVVVLASSVCRVVGRDVVVRVNLHESVGRSPSVQSPFLALIPW